MKKLILALTIIALIFGAVSCNGDVDERLFYKQEKNVFVEKKTNVPQNAAQTFTADITPADISGTGNDNKTTIEFPAGSFGSTEEVVTESIKVVVYPTMVAAANFTVNDTDDAVAGLDLTVTVDDVPVTTFNDKVVVVTTYVAKNLTNVRIHCGSDTWTKVDNEVDVDEEKLYYNQDSGKLVFGTTHFSQFLLSANEVAYVESSNTAYQTLGAAILNAESDDTVVLLKDVTHENEIELNKSITINGNNHTLTSTGDSASGVVVESTPGWGFYHGVIDIVGPNIVVKLSNVELVNVRAGGTALSLKNTAENSKVELNNVEIKVAKQYGIYAHVGSVGQELTLNDVSYGEKIYSAVYWRGSKGKLVANNTDFSSFNESNAPSNSFTTFCIERPLRGTDSTMFYSNQNEFTFNNCSFARVQNGTALQTLLLVGSEGNTIKFNNTEFKDSGLIQIAGKTTTDGTNFTDMNLSKIYVDEVEILPINAGHVVLKETNLWGDASQKRYWPSDGYYDGTFDHDITNVTDDSKSVIEEGYQCKYNVDGTWTVVKK